ncbi:OmpW family protein [Sesbania bispinosa]|nr:OmpW family protein [Sesbania bispinosa]
MENKCNGAKFHHERVENQGVNLRSEMANYSCEDLSISSGGVNGLVLGCVRVGQVLEKMQFGPIEASKVSALIGLGEADNGRVFYQACASIGCDFSQQMTLNGPSVATNIGLAEAELCARTGCDFSQQMTLNGPSVATNIGLAEADIMRIVDQPCEIFGRDTSQQINGSSQSVKDMVDGPSKSVKVIVDGPSQNVNDMVDGPIKCVNVIVDGQGQAVNVNDWGQCEPNVCLNLDGPIQGVRVTTDKIGVLACSLMMPQSQQKPSQPKPAVTSSFVPRSLSQNLMWIVAKR